MSEINQQIAALLGWRVVETTDNVDGWRPPDYTLFDPQGEIVQWDDGCGDGATCAYHSTEARAWQHAPDYEGDLNTVVEALGRDDLAIQFQPDQPLTFTIYVTSFGNEPRPSFVACETDVEWGSAEDGWQPPTLQQLAARALYAWLTWKRGQS